MTGRPNRVGATASMARPLVIGHRGASGRLPENTLVAFRGAADDGADGIELDVRMSADGVPVVIHDATLRRTTGHRARVADLTADQLAETVAVMPLRPLAPPHAIPLRPTRELGVPTLEAVLGMRELSQLLVYVELKGRRSADSAIDEAVVHTIARTRSWSRVVVLSFNHAALRRVRRLDDRIRTAATIAPELRLPRPSPTRLAEIVLRAEATEAALHVSLATRRRVAGLRAAGLQVTAWTVNSPIVGAYLARIGVDTVITDYPARLAAVRARFA